MSDDILVDVDSLVTTNWVPANTSSRTPTVINIGEVKRINQCATDFVLIWELDYNPEDNAAGGAQKRTKTTIMLDVRTGVSRAHAVDMRLELRRILNAAQVDVFSDGAYDISDIIEERDKSDKMVKLFQFTFKWQLEQFTLAI